MSMHLDTLREGIRGTVTGPGRRRVRRGPHGPQRHDRQAAGGDRAAGQRRRRDDGRPLRRRQRPDRRRARRRRTACRASAPADGGGRHRPVGDARRPGRPADPDGPGRGRCDLGRPERRDVPVRAGHDRRDHLDHRGRRPDPGRRHRLPRPRARARRWTTCCRPTWSPADGDLPRRQREGRRRPLLGDPRRRRQLRRRHVLRVPAQPGQGHLRRADVLRARQGRRPAPVLPRVHRRRARAVRRLPGVPDRAAAAVHPGGPARRDLHRAHGRLLGRRPRPGREGAASRSATWHPWWRRWSGRCPTRRSTAPSTRLYPPGLQHYWKANFVKELTDDAIAAHVEHGLEGARA